MREDVSRPLIARTRAHIHTFKCARAQTHTHTHTHTHTGKGGGAFSVTHKLSHTHSLTHSQTHTLTHTHQKPVVDAANVTEVRGGGRVQLSQNALPRVDRHDARRRRQRPPHPLGGIPGGLEDCRCLGAARSKVGGKGGAGGGRRGGE